MIVWRIDRWAGMVSPRLRRRRGHRADLCHRRRHVDLPRHGLRRAPGRVPVREHPAHTPGAPGEPQRPPVPDLARPLRRHVRLLAGHPRPRHEDVRPPARAAPRVDPGGGEPGRLRGPHQSSPDRPAARDRRRSRRPPGSPGARPDLPGAVPRTFAWRRGCGGRADPDPAQPRSARHARGVRRGRPDRRSPPRRRARDARAGAGRFRPQWRRALPALRAHGRHERPAPASFGGPAARADDGPGRGLCVPHPGRCRRQGALAGDQ